MGKSTIKLPTDKVAELKKAQRELHDILAELDRAEECDIDCQVYREIQQAQYEQVSKLLEHYG